MSRELRYDYHEDHLKMACLIGFLGGLLTGKLGSAIIFTLQSMWK